MKIIKTIKWLFNTPPVNVTNDIPDGTKCDYCGRNHSLFLFKDVFCICHYCMKESFDKILAYKKYRKNEIEEKE